MDRIEEFKLLLLVAHSGSFSAAARAGNLSPSTVSKLVTRIEQRAKIRLFDRTSKAVHATREGEGYLASLSRVIDAVADVDSVADALARKPHGILRVFAGPAFARNHIAPLLLDFTEQYPDMQVEFRLGTGSAKMDDGVDIAIQFGPLPDSSFIARKIATSRRVLCASTTYLEQRGAPGTVDELASHRLLNYSMPDRSHWPFLIGGEFKSVKAGSVVTADQADFLLELALRGMGIARLPEYLTHQYTERGDLTVVLDAVSLPEGIFAIFRDRKNLSPRLRVFIEALRENLRDQPWNLDRAARP